MNQEQDLQAVTKQVEAFRDAIFQTASDNEYSFDVVFNAIAQATSGFVFDYLLLSDGELTDENVAAAINKLSLQTQKVASTILENMRKFAESEGLTQEGVIAAAAKQAEEVAHHPV